MPLRLGLLQIRIKYVEALQIERLADRAAWLFGLLQGLLSFRV